MSGWLLPLRGTNPCLFMAHFRNVHFFKIKDFTGIVTGILRRNARNLDTPTTEIHNLERILLRTVLLKAQDAQLLKRALNLSFGTLQASKTLLLFQWKLHKTLRINALVLL